MGFRFSTHDLSRNFEVTGYVRNLPDGAVELVAEGSEEEVKGFVRALKMRMTGSIRSASEVDGEPTGRYTGFKIAF